MNQQPDNQRTIRAIEEELEVTLSLCGYNGSMMVGDGTFSFTATTLGDLHLYLEGYRHGRDSGMRVPESKRHLLSISQNPEGIWKYGGVLDKKDDDTMVESGIKGQDA